MLSRCYYTTVWSMAFPLCDDLLGKPVLLIIIMMSSMSVGTLKSLAMSLMKYIEFYMSLLECL